LSTLSKLFYYIVLQLIDTVSKWRYINDMQIAVTTKIDGETKLRFENMCKEIGSNISVEIRKMIFEFIKHRS